jgi:hypothetical protein
MKEQPSVEANMEVQSRRLWIVTLANIAIPILLLVILYGAVFGRLAPAISGWPFFVLLLIGLVLSVTGLRFTKGVVSNASRRVAFVVNGSALALDLLIVLSLATIFFAAPMGRLLSFLRSPADRAIQEDYIRESVFRYRLEHMQGNGPFFLSIDDKDPSDTFMARFANSNKTVKKGSGSYFKKEPFPGWLLDRSTDEKGVSFSVGPISWLSTDRVEVRGGMYCGGLCADGGIYRLTKKNGRWVVDEYKIRWVS